MSKIQSLKSVAGKETIYVDIDDEITTIIDKVQNAKSKVVALVLPKRATVLQSIVNMKLLKRTAESAEKNLVLITSEAGLLPLAGAVGLYVASTPNSRPSVPDAPASPNDDPEDADEPLKVVDGNSTEEFDPEAAAGKTVGELAKANAAKGVADPTDGSIDMADDADEQRDDESEAKMPPPDSNSKLRVPNFDSFRKRLALGVVVVILLGVGWVYAFKILPKATITIKTDTSTIATNADLVLDTAAKELSVDSRVVPATAGTQSKTASQQVDATGSQNNGEKATGTVTVINCTNDHSEVHLPAGRSISTGGRTYTLNTSVNLTLSGVSGNKCVSAPGFSSTTVGITALKAGTDYNVSSGTTFSASTTTADSFSSSEVKITGSASGGTDDIIKIVTQSDIDGATAKIASSDSSNVKQQIIASLQAKGLQPITSTFLAGAPEVSSTAKAGDAADTVTVTAVTAYTMLGVQKSDLQKLVTANVEKHIDKSKQVILDDGVANAKFTQENPGSATGANVSMQAKSVAGPQLDIANLKAQLLGKKAGDVKKFISATPGVTKVEVGFSPFWVNVVPKNADKVTIDIVKADG